MKEDFQFASVSKWYENTFGEQLALLPSTESKEKENAKGNTVCFTCIRKILEEIGENGQRITIEIGKDTSVEAMNGGFVGLVGQEGRLW